MRLSRSANGEFQRPRRSKAPISGHPAFVPILTAWGAALLGLIVMVLPSATIQQVVAISALDVLGGWARSFFAVLAAAIGMACGYFTALKWRGECRAASNAMVHKASQHVQPIDPSADLGSDSLDAPIAADPSETELLPPAPEQSEQDESLEDDGPLDLTLEAICDADTDTVADTGVDADDSFFEEERVEAPRARPHRRSKEKKEAKRVELVHALSGHMARMAAEADAARSEIPEKAQSADQEDLDLGAFAELPHENETASPQTLRPVGSAREHLRAVSPQELSLVQMVERLALALQDHKQAKHALAASHNSAERDAVLADALKTLSMFTRQGFAPASGSSTEASEELPQMELRDALGKLHELRGAA